MGMPAVDKLLKLPLSLQREPEGLVQLLTSPPERHALRDPALCPLLLRK